MLCRENRQAEEIREEFAGRKKGAKKEQRNNNSQDGGSFEDEGKIVNTRKDLEVAHL